MIEFLIASTSILLTVFTIFAIAIVINFYQYYRDKK